MFENPCLLDFFSIKLIRARSFDVFSTESGVLFPVFDQCTCTRAAIFLKRFLMGNNTSTEERKREREREDRNK